MNDTIDDMLAAKNAVIRTLKTRQREDSETIKFAEARVDELYAENERQRATIAALQAENAALRAELAEARTQLSGAEAASDVIESLMFDDGNDEDAYLGSTTWRGFKVDLFNDEDD
jgi:regulator of replication initiation timing